MKLEPKVILLFLALYFGYKYKDDISVKIPNFGNAASVSTLKDRAVSEPDAVLKIAVQPIIDAVKNSKTTRNKTADSFAFGDFYGDFAKVLIYKDGPIKTTGVLRDTLVSAGRAHFGNIGHTESDYPGLAKALETYFSSQMGLDNVVLDVDKTSKVFLAAQWAFYEAVK